MPTLFFWNFLNSAERYPSWFTQTLIKLPRETTIPAIFDHRIQYL